MKLEGYSNYEIYPEEGRVWSYKSNRFIGSFDKDGYLIVGLVGDNGKTKTYGIHRVIWLTVNGNIPKNMEINHIDEDKTNNSISNLVLTNHTDNCNWGTRNKRIIENRKGKFSKKPVVSIIGNTIVNYYPSTRGAEKYGFYSGPISNCCNGKSNTYKGLKWKYVDDYLADWWEEEMEKATF